MLATGALAAASAEELIPTADGTTWVYEMTQEAGGEFAFRDGKASPDGKVHTIALYRITGTQDVDARTLQKFEMIRDNVLTNIDLMKINDDGILCYARINQYGELTKLDPPQTIVATPLKPGAKWEFNSKISDSKVRQRYDVVGEEDVDLPAGTFHAVHIHGEQTEPMLMTIDRWFVNGTGIVKDVTTMKMPDGDLLRRISLELKERPKIAPRPEVKPLAPPKKISVTVGKTPMGGSTNQFGADEPKIYARWQGRDLPLQTKIRVVWVAEDVADVAPPDYIIDEASGVANSPDAHGTFTLSRPDGGWAPGDYRVDFYLDAELADSAKLKITK
jgi:hypothetical protein